MILDFLYKTDSLTERIVQESGGLRKYLLPLIRNNKVADILSVFSIVLFENFYKEKLLTKKNRYNINETSSEYLKNIIWELGHTLTIGDFYTNSDEYFRRQARTLAQRIIKKNTRGCYIYLFYVYGFNYNYSYRANVISNSNRISNIIEGTDNITVGAVVYGEGIQKGTFVIAKGSNYVDLSQNIILRNNLIGYGLIYSFYNEDIDTLISSNFPKDSFEPFKGATIAEIVDVKNYFLDYDLKTPVSINITETINSLQEEYPDIDFSNLTFYSSNDSPRIIEESGQTYLTYDYLSLDEKDPIYIVKPNGALIKIPKADLSSWYLDYNNISQITSRHFVLNYIMSSVETDSDFITKSSSTAFYKDVLQSKRLVEVPHFEPKLNLTFPVGVIPPNPLNTFKFPNLYTFTSNNETRLQGRLNPSATMINICFSDILSDITHIQFGKGRRTDYNNQAYNSSELFELFNKDLNDDVLNKVVSIPFKNEDLILNSIEFKEANSYRFINPLNYLEYTELFKETTLPDLTQEELDIVNAAQISENLPYYQLTKDNRWSFPINYFKIEKLTIDQLIIRNYLFPYFKWSSFSEIAFLKKIEDDKFIVLLYCTFPTVNYDSDMLSSIYINLFLRYNFEEELRKLTFTFLEADWITGNDGYSYLQIPYAETPYDNYIAYSFTYVKPEFNDPDNPTYYFYQNIGFNPSIYVFRRLDYNSELQGFNYEQIEVESIVIDSLGIIKIKIKIDDLVPFTGKFILI